MALLESDFNVSEYFKFCLLFFIFHVSSMEINSKKEIVAFYLARHIYHLSKVSRDNHRTNRNTYFSTLIWEYGRMQV